jgi:hypothetical protein
MPSHRISSLPQRFLNLFQPFLGTLKFPLGLSHRVRDADHSRLHVGDIGNDAIKLRIRVPQVAQHDIGVGHFSLPVSWLRLGSEAFGSYRRSKRNRG